MKNLLIILSLILSSFVFAQNTKYITDKDFVTNGKDQFKCDKMIKTENGENEFVNTKLFINKDATNKNDSKFFNKMIYHLLVEGKYSLKNKSTFKPIEINIYQDKETWFTNISFSGKNDMGGTKDGSVKIVYDNEFKIIRKL